MNTITLRRHATTAMTVVVLFWVVTAAGVAIANRIFEPGAPGTALIAKIFVILAMAFAYMRLASREATIEQAFFVGVGWATLSILAEVIAVTNSGHGWYALLGTPAHAAFRNVLLLVWIAAPALFARRRS